MVQHRLSPSGAPLLPAANSGIPFLRRYVAPVGTTVYRPPETLDILAGPAGIYPALFGFNAPRLGKFQAQLRLDMQLRWANPKGGAIPQDNAGTVQLQVSEDGGSSWIAPLWQGLPGTSNGLHVINRTITATIFDDTIAISADHIWECEDVTVPLLCRAAWTCTETGFDVYSSYNDENNPSGGWSFEGFLAESPYP